MEQCSEWNTCKKFKADAEGEERSIGGSSKSLFCYFAEYTWEETGGVCTGRYRSIMSHFERVLPHLVTWNARKVLHAFLHRYLKSRLQFSHEQLSRMRSFTQKLIEAGASAYVYDEDGRSCLDLAAKCCNRQILEVLTSCLVDVNETDARGNTALHIVVENCINEYEEKHKDDYVPIVRRLVCKGADVNKKNQLGLSAVHLAAEIFQAEVLQILADNGADFKLLTDRGETALHLACKSLYQFKDASKIVETISFLLVKGCDLELLDDRGKTSLHYIVESGQMQIIEKFVEYGANVNCQTKSLLLTPLHLAASRGRLDVMKTLVEAGAKVDAEAADGATPLFQAVLFGSFECMQYLIDRGADFYKRDRVYGLSLLHLTAYGDDEQEIFEFLIDKGLQVNEPACCGFTVLQLATIVNRVDLIESLLKQGADVNYQADQFEWTALHFASMWNNVKVAELLIEAGADVNCHGGIKQQTPLQLMVMPAIDWNLGKYQAGHDATSSSIKLQPKEQDPRTLVNCDLMGIFINHGAVVNERDASGRTALHSATFLGRTDTIRLLLQAGAYPNIHDKYGQTPLFIASRYNDVMSMELLVEFGANIDDAHVIRQILTNRGKLRNIAIERTTKLKLIDLPFNEVYDEYNEVRDIRFLFKDCSKEIVKLKKHRIADSTLYQFLHMDAKRRYHCVQDISDRYKSLKKLYPLYFNIIHNACCEALYKRMHMQSARNALIQLSQFHLPDICIDIIFSYLKETDLEALVLSEHILDEQLLLVKDNMRVMSGCVRRTYRIY